MRDALLLVAGAGLFFGALLTALLWLITWRVPRAQGLANRPGIGLSGVAQRAEALTDNVLARGGQRTIISGALERAGLDLRPAEFMVIVCSAAAVLGVAGAVAIRPLAGLLAAVATLVVSRVVVSVLVSRRCTQFSDQLAETLQLLTGSLRAGNGLAQALETVARESESPTAEEFRRLLVEVRLGRDLSEAMGALAQRTRSRDLLWVVEAIDINQEIGGNLAEILDTITGTIRDRGRLRRHVSALTAEGRLSAIVVLALPFALAGMMSFTNPAYLRVLYTTTAGVVLLFAGTLLLIAGGLWLRQLIRPVF